MKSLEEVIKYKLSFLPEKIDPFYDVQTYVFENCLTFHYSYEMKNHHLFSRSEDIYPIYIYILSCAKYYIKGNYREFLGVCLRFKYAKED